jgi:hypothetical protein
VPSSKSPGKFLHKGKAYIEKFHEMKLNIDSVEKRVENIAELVRLAEDKNL